MSYLDKIIQCNTYDSNKYLSFILEGELLGFPQKVFANELMHWKDLFSIEGNTLSMNSSLSTPKERTKVCQQIMLSLHQKGVIDSWVGEQYSVVQKFGEEPRFLIERAAVTYFGLRGFGVHVNGLVKKTEGIFIWVARRTKEKPFWPGKLDQIVAGGQPAGIGLIENVIKESQEEASISRQLSSQAQFVSEISYQGETHRGMNVDTLFNYDLWLPENFKPENTDGEVDEFILMPIEEMAYLTEKTDEFKDNCNLVNIDLLIRMGLIKRSHPDYDQIMRQLYGVTDSKVSSNQ